MNLDRAMAAQGLQVWRGQSAAMTGRPHVSLVDAMVDDPDQVDVVAQQIEAERDAIETKAKVEARHQRADAQG